MEIKTKKEFTKLMTKKQAINFLQRTFTSGNIKSVHVHWNFDEEQADAFHHFWEGETFIQAIKTIIK